ncbi:TIGR03773 family transporter-associated surface protein [Streptomyces mayonensis]|uniref:TIGR03773 family transporter-associated surface protein n=1 Tax=Streptomyces mayonensis TaxID=2750816 RepID=UPI001C1E5023|nr:TIGR03773 family transporter-associated surface protein [Streptomyces sp. A108]MBU6530349.1 TIGR03773 family transporter-associated surface protein [Streptomyces sp. A108]
MRNTALRSTAAALAAAVCLTLSALTPAAGAESADPGTAGGRTVVGSGHVDIGPRFAEDGWTVQIRDDTAEPPVWRDTDDVVLQVRDTAKIQAPGGEEFGFLGAQGDEVWVVPQAQQEGVVWPGWNSQDPQVTATVDREVTWELTGVTGPGDFVLFLNGAFGTPEVVFDGSGKLPQETGIEVNSHVHGNWAFTEPGTYLLDVRMKATTKDGKAHDSRRTLHFSVGPQDPEKAFTAAGSDASGPDPTRSASGVRAEASSGGGDSSSAPLWWGTGAAVVAAGAGLFVLQRRRRGDDQDPAATTQASAPGSAKGENDGPA